MSDKGRRAFLKQSTIALSGLAVGACREPGAEPGTGLGEAGPGPRLDPSLLRAVARVALPAELGEERTERAVTGFESWVEAFEPVAELPHGYGEQEIRYGPPDPAPRWRAQLEALELEARKRFGSDYSDLDSARGRGLLERQLGGSGSAPETLPGQPARADHVAVGLLAWFYGSSEATDLCYGRRIGPLTCRPLAAAPDEPTPLGDGT